MLVLIGYDMIPVCKECLVLVIRLLFREDEIGCAEGIYYL